MKILGIIAEYDPFHRGHERHLLLAREAVRPDYTYVVLSGCFKQRGEPAMLSPYDRAECALSAGADAVFALPTAWTVRDAEHYALGAVSLVKNLGATHLAFGAETADFSLLRAAAEEMENPSAAFQTALKDYLAEGNGYPRALSRAIGRVNPEAAEATGQPNSILAICYLRAIKRLGGGLIPVLIPRNGAYHAEQIEETAPSASAIRAALERGDYAGTWKAVPEISKTLLQRAFLSGNRPRADRLEALVFSRLRTMSREELRRLPDLSEGIEDRILHAARETRSLEELLENASGRRYSRARIQRICTWAVLGGTAEGMKHLFLPERAVLLGLRDDPKMTSLWKEKKQLITARWQDPADLQAWKIWGFCSGRKDTLPWTERVRKAGVKDGSSILSRQQNGLPEAEEMERDTVGCG